MTIYQVEEWESENGSFSYEFTSKKAAEKQMRESLRKPSYGTRKVRMWKCVMLTEKEVTS